MKSVKKQLQNAVSIYPKPGKGQLQLSFAQYSSGLHFVVLNAVGQQLLMPEKLRADSFGALDAELTGVSAGLYVRSVFSDGKSLINKKIIIK